MINNDILRRLRYTFDFDDKKMIAIFALGGITASVEEVRSWLKPEEDAAYKSCGNPVFLGFLDGLIIDKRGPKDGPADTAAPLLNNNVVFRKLKIALNLQADDIMDIMATAEFRMSKHELSAFFRNPDHKHYRECKDQILRNFLNGLQKKYRAEAPEPFQIWKNPTEPKVANKDSAKKPKRDNKNAKTSAGATKKPKQVIYVNNRPKKHADQNLSGEGKKKTLRLKVSAPDTEQP